MYRSPQCMICGNLVFFWSIMGMPNYYLTTKTKIKQKQKQKHTKKSFPSKKLPMYAYLYG